MWKGHIRKKSDDQEMLANLTAWIVQSAGTAKPGAQITAETILGRPLRAAWEAARNARKEARKRARLEAESQGHEPE